MWEKKYCEATKASQMTQLWNVPALLQHMLTGFHVRMKENMGAVCLVCRPWKDCMAPIMWREHKTDLAPSDTRSIVVLIHPQSGIMPHIRQLDICIQTNNPDAVDRLRLAIGALPRDKLHTFSADDHIDTLTFQLLLQSQRKFKSICIKIEFTTLGRLQESHLLSPDFRTWMISLTSETVAMALHMESDGEQGKQTCKTLCSMMQDYPNLEELDLVSYSHKYSLNTVLSHTTGASLFANLAYLSLWGVNVASGGSDGFCRNLDLAMLQDLRMIGCDYLKPFFEGLSRFYAKILGS
jgi:hypothetical protein